MSRELYMVKTVASAAHLLASCVDVHQIDTIMARMTEMLNAVWEVEHRAIEAIALSENRRVATKAFWDAVSYELVCTVDKHCYSFLAVYGEEVNPPGTKGNVHITFQANRSVSFFLTKLKLSDDRTT